MLEKELRIGCPYRREIPQVETFRLPVAVVVTGVAVCAFGSFVLWYRWKSEEEPVHGIPMRSLDGSVVFQSFVDPLFPPPPSWSSDSSRFK